VIGNVRDSPGVGKIPTFRPKHLQGAGKAQRRAYERQPSRAEDRAFYSSRPWRELRALKLSMQPTCEPCEAAGRVTVATQVHHIKERKPFPSLALDLDNLESCCLPCHNAKRRHEGDNQGHA
jgi:5-methylcytosine-specific restriction endonuclease McrA